MIKVYTKAEAAAVLNIGLSSVLKLLKSGELRHKKMGAKYLITEESIREYLECGD